MGVHLDPLSLATNGVEVEMIRESMILTPSFQTCRQAFRFLMGLQRWIISVKH